MHWCFAEEHQKLMFCAKHQRLMICAKHQSQIFRSKQWAPLVLFRNSIYCTLWLRPLDFRFTMKIKRTTLTTFPRYIRKPSWENGVRFNVIKVMIDSSPFPFIHTFLFSTFSVVIFCLPLVLISHSSWFLCFRCHYLSIPSFSLCFRFLFCFFFLFLIRFSRDRPVDDAIKISEGAVDPSMEPPLSDVCLEQVSVQLIDLTNYYTRRSISCWTKVLTPHMCCSIFTTSIAKSWRSLCAWRGTTMYLAWWQFSMSKN